MTDKSSHAIVNEMSNGMFLKVSNRSKTSLTGTTIGSVT